MITRRDFIKRILVLCAATGQPLSYIVNGWEANKEDLKMAYYFFVPGGKRKKDDWDDVRAVLESDGLRTYAITLSDPEYATLSDHISEVCCMIHASKVRDIYLVGHSYASFVITGVANTIPEKIARLIYIDSAIPENGNSLFDIFHLAGIDPGKFGVPEWPPFTERLFFNQATINKIPKTYIHCVHSQFLEMTQNITRNFRKQTEGRNWIYTKTWDSNWSYFELDSDHYCMLKNPKELAEIIS
jgi:pimeloyl-ACP methyl ester carboxylesterase